MRFTTATLVALAAATAYAQNFGTNDQFLSPRAELAAQDLERRAKGTVSGTNATTTAKGATTATASKAAGASKTGSPVQAGAPGLSASAAGTLVTVAGLGVAFSLFM